MTFELRLLLCILTSFRVAQLFALDDGPLYVFTRLREHLGIKASEDNCRTFRTSIADLMSCPYCIGIWASALSLILIIVPTFIGDVILLWLGISGGQAFLQSIVDKKL